MIFEALDSAAAKRIRWLAPSMRNHRVSLEVLDGGGGATKRECDRIKLAATEKKLLVREKLCGQLWKHRRRDSLCVEALLFRPGPHGRMQRQGNGGRPVPVRQAVQEVGFVPEGCRPLGMECARHSRIGTSNSRRPRLRPEPAERREKDIIDTDAAPQKTPEQHIAATPQASAQDQPIGEERQRPAAAEAPTPKMVRAR